jgi:hypothetical protein
MAVVEESQFPRSFQQRPILEKFLAWVKPEEFRRSEQLRARWRSAGAVRGGDHGHRDVRGGDCRDVARRRAGSNWIVRLGLTFWSGWRLGH